MRPDDLIRLAGLAERRQVIRTELADIERQLIAAGIEIETAPKQKVAAQPLTVPAMVLTERPRQKPTIQCSAKGVLGNRCTFPSKTGSHLCQRHTSMRSELVELSSEPETIARCSARSGHGEPCARAAIPGSKHCRQHAPCEAVAG